MEADKKIPNVEEITLDKALSLLMLHHDEKLTADAKPKFVVAHVIRDPRNVRHIISISLNEAF
jgi:hypothetical protein